MSAHVLLNLLNQLGKRDKVKPTVKPVLSGHSKIDKTKLLMTDGSLTLSLPNATVVEFTLHCQMRLQSKFKDTVDSCLFLTVIRDANLCSLFQNVQGT